MNKRIILTFKKWQVNASFFELAALSGEAFGAPIIIERKFKIFVQINRNYINLFTK